VEEGMRRKSWRHVLGQYKGDSLKFLYPGKFFHVSKSCITNRVDNKVRIGEIACPEAKTNGVSSCSGELDRR
jgi:hypothetical protein